MKKLIFLCGLVCVLSSICVKNYATAVEIDAGKPPVQSKQPCSQSDCYALFRGAWFEIKYPANFSPRIVKKSSTNQTGADAVVFLSPDKLVEFYIFSPQWGGVAPEIELNPKTEKLDSKKSSKTQNGTITWSTISSLKGEYSRSYQAFDSSSGYINWVVGIKYNDMSAYERYKSQYILFKKSLVQFADH
jgi:hypothetical protein